MPLNPYIAGISALPANALVAMSSSTIVDTCAESSTF